MCIRDRAIIGAVALLDLVDGVHAGNHFAEERVLAGQRAAALVADEELRIRRIRRLRTGHAERADLVGRGRKFGGQVRQVGLAGAGAGRIAGLGHEAVDDAVKDDAVVEAFADQLLDVGDVVGREICLLYTSRCV